MSDEQLLIKTFTQILVLALYAAWLHYWVKVTKNRREEIIDETMDAVRSADPDKIEQTIEERDKIEAAFETRRMRLFFYSLAVYTVLMTGIMIFI